MLRKTGFIFFIFFSVLAFSFQSSNAQEAKIESLDSLIEEALENNPRIKSAYNEWKVAEHKVKQVSSLPDPMATYTHFGDNVETRVGPQEKKYGVSQKIPFPGKLSLKGKVQDKHAQMFKEKYEAVKLEVTKNVKFIYYDIFWVDKAVQITEEEKGIIETLEKVAQRKYEMNMASQQDVLKAQVELSKLIDRLFMLRQNRDSLVAKLNSILNRQKDTALGKIGSVEPQEFSYKREELHSIAKEQAAELLVADLDVERAEYEKSLAKLDYFPDFTLGFDYIEVGSGHTTMPNDGQDAWVGMIGITLPIWFDKLNAQVKEKEAALESRRNSYQEVENSVVYEVEDLYFKIIAYKDIISLYKTALIPQTEQAFEAARTGYESGKVDFLNWLESERILLQTRLAYYKAIVDYQKSIAYLERVIGKSL
ncbi:MAG: TolC family protein [Candidatus Omnitrophota bacterium]